MPLPIAHGMLGASVVLATHASESRTQTLKAVMLGAFLGILPDFDLFFSWVLGWGTVVHGGPTHSACFAGLVGFWVARWRKELTLKSVLSFSGAMFTHGLSDMLVRKEFGGAALYWPFSDERLRFGLFDYFAFYPGSDPAGYVVWRALEVSFYELLIFSPCLLLAWLIRAVHQRLQQRQRVWRPT
jgi:hypothetical protein